MPAQVSETFVLRTYPYREADLIVSFFTRDQGKLRGVARRAKRPKSAFGSGLERLSHVRMAYFLRENSELANLSGCELIESQFALQSDYGCSLALDYFTEVTDQLMPPHEPNEKFFRLLNSTLEVLRSGGSMWSAVDYFTLWSVRLTGVLPELRVSNRETVEIVEEMFVKKLADLTPRDWTQIHVAGTPPHSDSRHGAARRAQVSDRSSAGSAVTPMDTFQDTVFKLKRYWADRGAIIQEPYDVEVGAGTNVSETFLRVLGPKPYRVAYVQPSRRPADGRYGENPNRLYKHQQLQVILKPSPDDVLDQYLGSLKPSASIFPSTTSSSRKTTGKRPRWARGASAGR